MPAIPTDGALESSFALLADPYRFIAKRCERLRSDLFQTRIAFRPVICMTGAEAAELICDSDRFIRRGAPFGVAEKTLFGKGGVQGLDDDAHRHRKQMFMSQMTPERVARLASIFRGHLRDYASKWQSQGRITLYPEMREVICQAVCDWAAVPLAADEVAWRTHQLTALFDYAGSVGPKHLWSRIIRKRADRWCAKVIRRIRSGELSPPNDSFAYAIAWHRDIHNQLLTPKVAAVDLLNVLRPMVAVAVFITFAATAIEQFADCRRKLEDGDDIYQHAFVQEVRRFYPFFPSIMARVRRDFEWNGYPFPKGRRVMLDLYGTNHDPRIWKDPEQFEPKRFHNSEPRPFEFIPQGPGDPHKDHRCPGELPAIELMKVAIDFLLRGIRYRVPPQDLELELSRMPALPRSRFIMENIAAQTPASLRVS